MQTTIKSLANTLLNSGVAIVAMTSATAAMAQVSDSATVNVNADIQEAASPLVLSAVNDFEFGTVTIPNGSFSGHQCSYDFQADNSAQLSVSEVDSAGNTVSPAFPTPSGCEATGTSSLARFNVQCTAGTLTTISYAITSPLSGSGVVLTDASSIKVAAVDVSDFGGAPGANSTTQTMSLTCPDGTDIDLRTSGAFDTIVGARLLLGAGAAPGSNLNVGSITLTATY